MVITDFDEDGDGNISFLVEKENYEKIIAHLKSKRVHTWGLRPDTDFAEIFSAVKIEELNIALKDFEV